MNVSLVASGPVIIEDGKVLLNRAQKETGVTPWLFPGGKVEDSDASPQDACKREIREEMGIEIDIVRTLETLLLKRLDDTGYAVLMHYLANRRGEIIKGEGIVEYGWFDITSLPTNCASNVYTIISSLITNPMETKKLYRNTKDKMLTGVLAGIGEYFAIDPTLLRLLFVILTVMTGIFPFVIIYIIAAFIIPEKK
jgi:phage shock protein C